MTEEPKMIYLAHWNYSDGNDVSAHTTETGAFKQCVRWMRETLDEWHPPGSWDRDHYSKMSDNDLLSLWPEITDGEYMSVDKVILHREERDEKAGWDVDTSHIGA
tara:strand:- start:268 stop:582 length:315 start_codon:yes stop_codon:yes gene_type:complete